MNVAEIVARLALVPQLVQVVAAKSSGFQTPIDSGAELVSRLASVAPVFFNTMREAGTSPSIVYNLVSSQPAYVDGYRITQTDRYVLQLRADDETVLWSKFVALESALSGSIYPITVNDWATDYDDVQRQQRLAIDIEFSYPSTSVQALPSAFVYSVRRNADENMVDALRVSQIQKNQYGIVVVSATPIDPILDAIRAKLLGWQIGEHEPFQYDEGTNLEGNAGLHVWREIYFDYETISEATHV